MVRYETCGGLFNQHYCHLAGLTMAAALGADAVLVPPALARDRYEQTVLLWPGPVACKEIWMHSVETLRPLLHSCCTPSHVWSPAEHELTRAVSEPSRGSSLNNPTAA